MTFELWLLGILIALSAFFSGVEAAYLALTAVDIKRMIDKDRRWANTVKLLKEHPHKLVITILIGNNLVNIAASTIAASLAMKTFESNALGIATGIMTLLILIFGEITPKTLAIGHKRLVTRIAAVPLRIMGLVFYPVILVLDVFTRFLAKVFKAKMEEKVTEEEIKSVVSLGEESGTIEKEERRMINSILKFDDTEVSEIMTPRVDFFSVDSTDNVKEVTDEVFNEGRSRIPVFEDDDIVGVLFAKDMFECIAHGKTRTKIKTIMKKPLFIPEQKKIDELLKDFQKKKIHIAIVVDEYGSVTGLVTIEDILEEIVGEIYDESDKKEVLVKKISPNVWIINGGLRIDEVNEQLGLKLKESEDYDTISGMILKEIGEIPKVGEKIVVKKTTFIVEHADEQRITEVRVVKG